MKPNLSSRLPYATVLLVVLAPGQAWSSEPQTSVTSSEHQIRVASPVESSQFPNLAGSGSSPQGLAGPSTPIPPNWKNVLACTVQVNRQSRPREGVRASLSAEIVDQAGNQTHVRSRSRKTNYRGNAFFRSRVQDRPPPESFGWIARFRREEIDHVSGNCQMRSFAPCEESAEVCCIDNRFRVTVAYESGERGTCLGNGNFGLGGERVRLDLLDYCRRHSVKLLSIAPADGSIGSGGDPVEIVIVDIETGRSNLAWYGCSVGPEERCLFALDREGQMCAEGKCCP